MKIIYICSPYQNAAVLNTVKANLFCRFAAQKGNLPLAPHAIFTQFLDDKIKSERAIGINFGLRLLEHCDELWVFGHLLTKGMKAELEQAKKLKKIIRYFSAETMEEYT